MAGDHVQNTLLRGLDPSTLQDLLRNAERKPLDTGYVFFRAGTTPEWVFFPDSGIGSLVATIEDGAQVETGMVGYEGAVGITEALAMGPISSHATVQVTGDFWRVNAAACRSAFASETGRTTIERYGQFLLAEARQSVACSTFHSVERRLARWLWSCWRRGNVGNEIAITHEYIAAMIGSRRASITEALAKLMGAGIRTARGKIVVDDPDALAKAACECLGYIEDLRTVLCQPPPQERFYQSAY
jgi:CRP-like cAMP-binding protein